MTDTRRRVKLYALNADRQWDDRGTGHVSSSFVERLKGISLLVRAESDGSVLLESKIQLDTAYQKQQDTLIVWSEGDNFDLALSFQEKAGCDEIWEKICQVQGKDPSVEITQDMVEESEDERFDDMSDSAPPIELPPCELSRLESINELFASCLTSLLKKEKLAEAIENEGYIRKLLNLFHMCEDLDNLEGLHHLYEIFKNIFLLNKNALFEVMFAEDTIFDVVGCLEYDPSQPQPKHHRQYLTQQAKFREAIPIRNPELLAKIHQTFRVQYIQDVVIPTPSVFEDNLLSTLSSFIFFNKVEIVTMVQEDENFLTDLFNLLTDENTSKQKRCDSVLFLKEFCNYSQNLQPQPKETFYKTLTSLGILSALEFTLAVDDKKTKSASIDILTYIVEFSPSVVREYTLQQGQMLLNVIIEQMISDSDPELGGAMQLIGILRLLLDPENMLTTVTKTEKSDFLMFFYKHSFQIMIAPLLANTARGVVEKDDYHSVQLLGLILELLTFCVEHHTYHIKNCIINKDLLGRILVLMKSEHKFLVLSALRFLRKVIALKDEYYNRHIIKNDLLKPVVDTLLNNSGRYNLVDSAILELFEFIKLEDIRSLCAYVMENFGKFFEKFTYVQTFKSLKQKYEQQQDKLKDRERCTLESVPSILRNTGRFRRDQRQLEEEEDMWFNEEDDFEEGEAVVPANTQNSATLTTTSIALTTNNNDLSLTTQQVVTATTLANNQQSPTTTAIKQNNLEQIDQTETTSINVDLLLDQTHKIIFEQEEALRKKLLAANVTINSPTTTGVAPTNNCLSVTVASNLLTSTAAVTVPLSNCVVVASLQNGPLSPRLNNNSSSITTTTTATTSTETTVTSIVNNTTVKISNQTCNNQLETTTDYFVNNTEADCKSSSDDVVNETSCDTTTKVTTLCINSQEDSGGAQVKQNNDAQVENKSTLLKKGLVDYEGDSDEEEDEDVDLISPNKRQRLL